MSTSRDARHPGQDPPKPPDSPLLPFDPEQVTKRHGLHLPHWTQEGATYAVTFRLADALPRPIAEQWCNERDALKRKAAQATTRGERTRLLKQMNTQFTARFLALLDAGYGACHFREPEAARIVADALRHFDGERYHLHAWCVMPNHVHTVFQPLDEHTLESILHSWKSFTSNKLNRLLGRKGALWQKESYDHLIRDQQDFAHSIRYVYDNPGNAGLHDWPWVGPQPRASSP